MPTLSNDQLAAMSFGYLTGADLMRWCSPQLLIKQYEVNQTSLLDGCNQAQGEVIRMLLSRYAIAAEFGNVSGIREIMVVQITSILAVRNIMGNMAGISDHMSANFTWADKTLRDIRNGFTNLILPSANVNSYSSSGLIPQNFSTLG
jgi:hypothetical protein